MSVQLRAEDERFVEHLVREGRFATAEEALHAGVRLLRAREASTAALRARLDSAVAAGGDFTSEEVLLAVDEALAAEPNRS